jgi:hypothetical protein
MADAPHTGWTTDDTLHAYSLLTQMDQAINQEVRTLVRMAENPHLASDKLREFAKDRIEKLNVDARPKFSLDQIEDVLDRANWLEIAGSIRSGRA